MSLIEFSEAEISSIRSCLADPTLELFLKQDWGSHNKGYRETLHTDLKLRGSVADSSISHTEGLGGYILSQNSGSKVGFDIEVIERVRPEVSRRISLTDDEYNQAPSAASFWAAKEASFKALKGPLQPRIVSAITIGSWQSHESQFETCRIENLRNFGISVAKGVVYTKSGFVFCFFSVRT